MTHAEIIAAIEKMTILELADLVKAMEEKFGVSAAAAEVVEEKTEFDVVLKAAGGQKLKVIKEVKDVAGLSLGEAKELVTSCPKMVKTGISKEEAEALKKQLEEVGATITIK